MAVRSVGLLGAATGSLLRRPGSERVAGWLAGRPDFSVRVSRARGSLRVRRRVRVRVEGSIIKPSSTGVAGGREESSEGANGTRHANKKKRNENA
ncbi:hypothetical protein MRX96_036531 [Rhipicephalus microplus]